MAQDLSNQVSLQLLLFVDHRPSSQEYIKTLQNYLNSLESHYPFQLEIIQLEDQPHLVEYFKLVVTPALVKIAPGVRQIIAGRDLIFELKKWWQRWQNELEEEAKNLLENKLSSGPDCLYVGYSAELLKLADEVFMLQKEKEELQKQLDFKEQIVAMLVHDLRSPLTAANLALDTILIAEKKQSPESFKILKEQLFRQIKQQFKLMERHIADILQATKNESKNLKIKPQIIILQEICQDILTQIMPKFQAKSQVLTSDLPQDLPPVYGDQELITQVLINLLENASKYTPPEGTIHLVLLHRTSQKIQVSIYDNGPGIPETEKDAIFQENFRLQRDEQEEGYGIGLALCRRVINAHYGQIWMENSPSGGSCFHFTLPVYRY